MGRFVSQTLPGDPNAMQRALRQPQRYRAYVPTLLGDLGYTPSVSALEHVAAAGEACRALDAAVGASPVKLARAMGLLSRSEGIGSATIENYTASMRRLVGDAATNAAEHSDDGSAIILRGIAATEQGLMLLGEPGRDVTAEDIEKVQAMLMSHFQQRYRGYRTGYVQVGGNSSRVDSADYIPPPAEHVPALVQDLCDYINEPDGRHPIVRAAIAHAQFEVIHPFPDGNGRTGRVLMHGVLRREGLLVNTVVPVSIAMARDPDAYVRGLNSLVFDGDTCDAARLDDWVVTFAGFVSEAAEQANTMLSEFESIYAGLAGRVRSAFRGDSHAPAVLGELSSQLGVTTAGAARAVGISEEAARRLLGKMVEEGLVQRRRTGRTTVFYIDALTRLIEDAQTFRMSDPVDMPPMRGLDLTPMRTSPARGRPRAAQRCAHPLRTGGVCMRAAGHHGPHRSKP